MRIAAALVTLTMASAGAWADEPAPTAQPPAEPATGAKWDDSHMQSRYRDTPRTQRPKIEGESGYAALATGTATHSAPAVQELEFTTQREWEQGKLSTGSKAKAAATASQNAPSTELGGVARGSTLRGGAASSRRRR